MKDRDLELRKEWVEPYYMFLINVRWLRESENRSQPYFVKIVQPAVAKVNDSIIEELISYRDWRHKVVGCWFAGIKKRSQYIEEISKSLGGYFRQMATCFALVRFNNDLSVYYLSQYLEEFIACTNNLKDEHWNDHHFGWAIQALTYLDRQQGNFYFQKYHLAKNEFSNNHSDFVYIKDEQLVFKRILNFCDLYFLC
jgi:Family of unknown function (DUF6000)